MGIYKCRKGAPLPPYAVKLFDYFQRKLLHKKSLSFSPDREAVQMLESRIRSERTGSGERALYHAALFLWLSGRHDKSREYADRLLKMAPSSIVGLSLRGWIDLTCGRETLVKKSIKYFEEAAAVHSKLR